MIFQTQHEDIQDIRRCIHHANSNDVIYFVYDENINIKQGVISLTCIYYNSYKTCGCNHGPLLYTRMKINI